MNARPALTLAQIERITIERRIRAHGGNKTHAARSLGISLKTLYNKLHRYGMFRAQIRETTSHE